MGFYDQTFKRINKLIVDLDGATAEETNDIYAELKRIRRDICRNNGTRHSYLVTLVMKGINKTRDAIASQKEVVVVQELYDVKQNNQSSADDYMHLIHTVTVMLAVVVFYILVLSTGRV